MLANESKVFHLGKKGKVQCSQCFGQHTALHIPVERRIWLQEVPDLPG